MSSEKDELDQCVNRLVTRARHDEGPRRRLQRDCFDAACPLDCQKHGRSHYWRSFAAGNAAETRPSRRAGRASNCSRPGRSRRWGPTRSRNRPTSCSRTTRIPVFYPLSPATKTDELHRSGIFATTFGTVPRCSRSPITSLSPMPTPICSPSKRRSRAANGRAPPRVAHVLHAGVDAGLLPRPRIRAARRVADGERRRAPCRLTARSERTPGKSRARARAPSR